MSQSVSGQGDKWDGEMVRWNPVAFYGVHKDGATLAAVIGKENVCTLVSDDAAVYQGFNEAQKCWTHLIRSAINVTAAITKLGQSEANGGGGITFDADAGGS
ncbi:MAG: hypothetical protein AAF958_13620, partial [Planctomycetota bacterium]